MGLEVTPDVLLLNYLNPDNFLRSEQQVLNQFKSVSRVTALRHLPSQAFPAQDEKGAVEKEENPRAGVLENSSALECFLKFLPSVAESVPCT